MRRRAARHRKDVLKFVINGTALKISVFCAEPAEGGVRAGAIQPLTILLLRMRVLSNVSVAQSHNAEGL